MSKGWIRNKPFRWLMPVPYIMVAIGLALLVDYIDRSPLLEHIPSYLLTESKLAETALSAIATSLLTMTTITFSVIMVVLSTYASQYTPRTLPNFIQRRIMHHTQGVFFAGFVYAITALLFLKRSSDGEQQVLDATVGASLAVFCLVVFIYFVHQVMISIQVNDLVGKIRGNGEKVIASLPNPTTESWEQLQLEEPISIPCKQTGYIRFVDTQAILKLAEKKQVYIKLVPRMGQFIMEGETLLHVFLSRGGVAPEQASIQKLIKIGNDRTNEQDLEYVMEKIVETALRAVSTGINDPNTAIYCIRELSRIMIPLAARPEVNWRFPDKLGVIRLEIPFLPLPELLYKCFYQLIHYGAKDLLLVAELLDTLNGIASGQRLEVKQDIGKFGLYVVHHLEHQKLYEMDQTQLDEKLRLLAQTCQYQLPQLKKK